MGEITARINQFWPAWDACRVDPSTCDIDGLIAEFATPDSRPAQFWRGFYGYMGSKNAHMTQPDKIENYVASINATGSDGVSEVCERNGAVLVAADGNVLDDTVGLTRFEWIWSKLGGKWMIVGGGTYQITDKGDAICDVYFQ